MNETVPRDKVALMNVLPEADRMNWSPTTTRIEASAAIGATPKKTALIAEVTPPIDANHIVPIIDWVLPFLGPTPGKNANVATVKVMTPKIVKPTSDVGARDIFGKIAAVGPNL